jgi:transposase
MLGRQFPRLETMLCDSTDELLAFTSFPPSHWKKVWSTNPLERVNKSAWNGRLGSAILVGHPRRTAGGATTGKEPAAMARIAHRGPIHLGLDVHRDTISVATLLPDAAAAAVEQIPSDEAAVRAFLGRFPEPARLRVCYEAGPTGYELARLLHRQGVACQVIAPSLTPRAVGDKVKTDRRDCRRLARLHRAGELVAIRIPTPREEAVRDLCRARADLVDDRSRARRRLQSFLLRHGRVYRAGACWTGKHERWLGAQRFDDHQLQATFSHYRAVVATRAAEVTAIEADLTVAATEPPFTEAVTRLAAYRGVGQLGALSVAAEVGDWRRFAHAAAFMAFTGLVPCERSSGDSVWRGHITRTGSKHLRFQLVESAWSYHHRPLIAGALRERQQQVSTETLARSWAAQLRLCRRFRQLERRKHIKGVAVVAVARELAGFLWAEMHP